MQHQDSLHLGDRLRILMSAVAGGNDEFALRIRKIAAPLGHKSVGLDRIRLDFVSTLAAITDDGVMRNGG